MDALEMFSELCKLVVEEQNVMLEVIIAETGVQMILLPINEEYESNDLMAENEFLRKQLAEALKHRRMFEADYEARLRADLVAMLTEIQLEIEELYPKARKTYRDGLTSYCEGVDDSREVIQQKINELKAESEG